MNIKILYRIIINTKRVLSPLIVPSFMLMTFFNFTKNIFFSVESDKNILKTINVLYEMQAKQLLLIKELQDALAVKSAADVLPVVEKVDILSSEMWQWDETLSTVVTVVIVYNLIKRFYAWYISRGSAPSSGEEGIQSTESVPSSSAKTEVISSNAKHVHFSDEVKFPPDLPDLD